MENYQENTSSELRGRLLFVTPVTAHLSIAIAVIQLHASKRKGFKIIDDTTENHSALSRTYTATTVHLQTQTM